MNFSLRAFSEHSSWGRSPGNHDIRKQELGKVEELVQTVHRRINELHDQIVGDRIQYERLIAESAHDKSVDAKNQREVYQEDLRNLNWDDQFISADLELLRGIDHTVRRLANKLLRYDDHLTHGNLSEEQKLRLRDKLKRHETKLQSFLNSNQERIERLQGLEVATLRLLDQSEEYLRQAPESLDDLDLETILEQTAHMKELKKRVRSQKHEVRLAPIRAENWRVISVIVQGLVDCSYGCYKLAGGR